MWDWTQKTNEYALCQPHPYDYFPRRLHPREIGNPYLAIRQFFDWENLPEWRNQLDKWLQAARRTFDTYPVGKRKNRRDINQLRYFLPGLRLVWKIEAIKISFFSG